MVQAAGEGGRSRTADLEAQRRAQEAARRAAEEAARKAAEEAARKAAQEAARKAAAERLSESKETPGAEKRQQAYDSAKTQPLSAETARLQEVTSSYGGADRKATSQSSTAKTDAAKDRADEVTAKLESRIAQAKDKFPDASGDAKGEVAKIQENAETEAKQILDTASEEADKLIQQAETLAADKSPEDQAKILAEADTRATAILDHAIGAAEGMIDKGVDVAEEGLKKSHDYENSNWFEKRASDLGNLLGNVWDKAKNLFETTVDAVDAVKDFAVEQAGDFADWAGEQAFKVVDQALDKSPLGSDAEYTQEKTGLLGDLVTNRLEVGESAFVKLDVDANINGVQLGAGAELSIKRVPASDENGNPKLEPLDEHGQPPTELEVTLLVDANAGVGLSAEFGVAGSTDKGPDSIQGNDVNPGAELGASAEAEAGLQAQAEFTFTFDPNSQKDMDDLTGVLGATAKTALPGIGMFAAPDAAKAAAAFGSHLTAIRGEAGIYATAQASASASIGNIDTDAHGTGSEVRVLGTDGQDGQIRATGNRVIDETTVAEGADVGDEEDFGLKGTAAGLALDQAGLDLGELTAGISGEVNVGGEHNFRTGETTVYLNVQGNAQATASTVGDLGGGVSAEANRTIAITLKDGELQGIDVIEEMSSSKFTGIGDQDVRGRLDDTFMAQVEESDSVTITRSYTDAALAEFKNQAGDSPMAALGNLTQSLMNPDPNEKLEVTDIKATKTDEFNVGFNVMGTGVQVGIGRRIESDVDNVNEPGKQNAEAREEMAAR